MFSREDFQGKKPKGQTDPFLDNPRASYGAENPTNPKIGQKYQPDKQIPLTAGDRKNTPKIPEKYPQNTNFVFLEYSRGYLKGYFGESHVLYVGGYFCTSLAFLFCSWSRGCQPFSRMYRRGGVKICPGKNFQGGLACPSFQGA